MENNKSFFLKQDRQARWNKNEVRKVLGDKLIEVIGDTIETVCVLGFRHKTAKIDMGHSETTYLCRWCLNEDRISREEQNQLFQAWLDENQLIDGKWKPHSNPFDSLLAAPELEYWRDSEGNPILYKGAIHFLYGKPATFKSWFAVSLLAEAEVRLWDFENGAAATAGRIEALGIDRERANGYAVPSSIDEVLNRVAEYRFTKPDILVIDGFAGLAEVMGINSESNHDVMKVFGEVLYPLREAGVAVVLLDHLPKDASNFDYPIGAQAKRSQSDVALLFTHTKSPSLVEMYVSKDRHGDIASRCEPGAFPRRFGTLCLTSENDSVSLSVSPAYSASIDGKQISATDADLLEKIYNYIEANPDQSKSAIETNVPGKTERKRKALKQLIDNGYVEINAIGTSHLHKVTKNLDLNWQAIGA